MDTVEIEVWVVIDENGDYGIGRDYDGAAESYANDIGELAAPMRTVKVALTVPLPRTVELAAVVPSEPSEGTVTVK